MSRDNLKKLKIHNIGFKGLLESQFDKKYFSELSIDSSNEEIGGSTESTLSYFVIERNEVIIKNKITSAEELNKVKTSILTEYEKLTQRFIDYFGRAEENIDDRTAKSVGIIIKIFKSRKRKLENVLNRFTVQDSWNVTTLGLEFELILGKFLKDLIGSAIRPILTGFNEHPVYRDILNIFNSYLAILGVYTSNYKEGDTVCDEDWNYLSPISMDDCETSDITLKNSIKTVYSYPYVIGDGVVVLEGEVALWKVI